MSPETDNSTANSSIFARFPWLPFVVPLVLYMAITTVEPSPEKLVPSTDNAETERFASYPVVYAGKIAITLVGLLIFLPIYRTLPFRSRPSVLAVGTGVIGAVLWIGLCKLQPPLIANLLPDFLVSPPRPSFNPFESFDAGGTLELFLTIRVLGMVLIVPLIEELFLRGFLVRAVADAVWEKQPFRQASPATFLVVIIYALATHPTGEMLAAVAWFSLITLLVYRTGSLWDAVMAHATTNGILAIYVIFTADWSLW